MTGFIGDKEKTATLQEEAIREKSGDLENN